MRTRRGVYGSDIPPNCQQNQPPETAAPALKLADIAHVIFPHLASSAANDDIALAEVCLLITECDKAGCFGGPGEKRDVLVNNIWGLVAAGVPAKPDSTELPSLYDHQKRHAFIPFRLLKEYLTVATLPFFGSAPHAELMAAIPKKVPPRLIAAFRRARYNPMWASRNEPTVAAEDMPLPFVGDLQCFPESLAVKEYRAGKLNHLMNEKDLNRFFKECVFLRKHTELEEHFAVALVECEASHALWTRQVDLNRVTFREIMDCYDAARFNAMIDIVESVGMKRARRLLGMPPSLFVILSRIDAENGNGNAVNGVGNAPIDSTWGLQPASPPPPPPPLRNHYVCGECQYGPNAGKIYNKYSFLLHWHRDHMRLDGTPEWSEEQKKKIRVYCGHHDCFENMRTFNLEGLTHHTSKHRSAPGAPAPVPVAFLVERSYHMTMMKKR